MVTEILLQPRRKTCEQLSTSMSTVICLENDGKLDKVRPSGKRNGKVFHRTAQVAELASQHITVAAE